MCLGCDAVLLSAWDGKNSGGDVCTWMVNKQFTADEQHEKRETSNVKNILAPRADNTNNTSDNGVMKL